MHVSAKVEYGLQALLALTDVGETRTIHELTEVQQLPAKFLGAILRELRRADIVTRQRGPSGGYRLARMADTITLAE